MPSKYKIRRNLLWISLCFAIAIFHPLIANSSHAVAPSTISVPSPSAPNKSANLLDRGKVLYQSGQYQAAIQVWQQAAKVYEQQANLLDLSITLSNLSLAYQKTGQWQLATTAIARSLEIVRSLPSNTNTQIAIAQSLDTQGNLQLAIGNGENALTTWKESATIYEKLGDRNNQLRNVIKQAQALKVLGFYRRSLQTLETVQATLQDVSDPLLKAIVLHNYGDMLTTVGDLKLAREPLDKSLKLLETIAQDKNNEEKSNEEKSIVYLRLGNLARLENNPETAQNFYKKSAQISTNSLLGLQAQLNLFGLLIESRERTAALELRSKLNSNLTNLSSSQDAIYAQINYGENLLKLAKLAPKSQADLLLEAAKILAVSVQNAKEINDSRTLAYAIGSLGSVYEQNNQIEESQQLTQKALAIAQSINAPDIAYRWQWQLGRLLRAKRDIKSAILAYTEAVNGLRQLRSDLAFVNPNVQFSFRESVEPLYRQLVSLLLQDETQGEKQKNLLKAQTAIESLQLAELVNFFRSDCLTAAQVDINQVDRTAAIIYPILLEDRLEVILSLPDQPLQHYASNITSSQIDSLVSDLRVDLRDPSSQDYLPTSQKLYDWLIRPAANAIAKSKIKTMVFVLDGSLRNIPMSVLHDGNQFLAENYSIALTPGLQLLDPKPIVKQKVNALIGGLTEARQGFSALPSVKGEVQEINKQIPLSSIFIDSNFTLQNLSERLTSLPFPIVHLATHGNFSSQAENTYLLTYDGRLTIDNLNQLLRSKNRNDTEPVELLILSACQTAVGDKRAALGLAGMAIRAGARSTIASLWSVDDQATAKFMITLYQSLSSGNVTRAESLRLAQQTLLKDKTYNHPYFWSPFVLLGNWL